ncbi:hypothetical protein L9F63_022505, partial [Diploptera punctata]
YRNQLRRLKRLSCMRPWHVNVHFLFPIDTFNLGSNAVVYLLVIALLFVQDSQSEMPQKG